MLRGCRIFGDFVLGGGQFARGCKGPIRAALCTYLWQTTGRDMLGVPEVFTLSVYIVMYIYVMGINMYMALVDFPGQLGEPDQRRPGVNLRS